MKSWIFEKMKKIGKLLVRPKVKKREDKINKIGNERRDITVDMTEIKGQISRNNLARLNHEINLNRAISDKEIEYVIRKVLTKTLKNRGFYWTRL